MIMVIIIIIIMIIRMMCINAHQQRDELHLLPSVVVLDGVVP